MKESYFEKSRNTELVEAINSEQRSKGLNKELHDHDERAKNKELTRSIRETD